MKGIIPPKLRPGDTLRIIAPSKSLATVSKEQREIAERRFLEAGINVSYGKHVDERNVLDSSTIASRVADIHAAFEDKNVHAILAAAGGFNSNELLKYIDWGVIRRNPKIFAGYSDITTLDAAIYAETGIITYASPNFASFCDKLHFNYTFDYFVKCLMEHDPYEVIPANTWSNNRWSETRPMHHNEGFWPIHPGSAHGTILGENLITLDLLKGTDYFPDIANSILFLEDASEYEPHHIEENLQALILDKRFKDIKGLVLGRFQMQSKITRELLEQIIASKRELAHLPIVANVDFGHTEPKITYPFGGKAQLEITKHMATIHITTH